jgi:branched-chain amino acid aminotransferase
MRLSAAAAELPCGKARWRCRNICGSIVAKAIRLAETSMKQHSETWNWFKGEWLPGNPPIMGPRTHAAWLASSVFDGARVFEGVMPDMDQHAARVNISATKMGLKPTMQPDEILRLTREGVKKFKPGEALYVKPMYWAEFDGGSTILPDPESTQFCLSIYIAPLPEPVGAKLTVSKFRRPTLETMPTDVKTGALYPNNARCLREALSRGFTNALVLDMLGNVAETASTNIFMVKDGVVMTPNPTGAFLNGITRQRTIKVMREAKIEVLETTLRVDDFLEADEIFTSGNYSKVAPVAQLETREFQPGPMYRRARELYWAYAHSGKWNV